MMRDDAQHFRNDSVPALIRSGSNRTQPMMQQVFRSPLVLALAAVLVVFVAFEVSSSRDERSKDVEVVDAPPAIQATQSTPELLPVVERSKADGRVLVDASAKPEAATIDDSVEAELLYDGYASQEAYYEMLASLCLSLLPSDWETSQLHWELGTNTYPNIPWGALSPEKALTAEPQRLVEDQVALFNTQIASEARVTHSLLNRYSREYVEGIKPVALNAPAPAMTPQEAAQMQNAAYSCLGTDVTTGMQFNIRFFSSDYPELEDSFQRIRTLKAERLATTKRLISEI